MNTLTQVAHSLGYGDVHCHFDPESGLSAIVALHSTTRGAAIGGCRYMSYDSWDQAMLDALKLGQAMSVKAAIHNLPHGGAKAVILKPNKTVDKTTLFRSFANQLNALEGRYITAVDMGTTNEDMDFLARHTSHVLSSKHYNRPCNPAHYTARGVFLAIQAACQHRLHSDDLNGRHIAVQGLGHVGRILCDLLAQAGARLSIADLNAQRCQMLAQRYDATVLPCTKIHSLSCDVFAPCAIGGIINDQTIDQIQAKIVVGAANNICEDPRRHGAILMERGITYVPDYLANGGGLIHASALHMGTNDVTTEQHLQAIFSTTMDVLETADKDRLSPSLVANTIAMTRLGSHESTH